MQSLPTPLTTAQLEGLLSKLATMPSAKVNRYMGAVTVTATRKADRQGVEVLHATTTDGQHWHVMTAPGLITTTTKATA
jgi:hypothetical protein